MDNLLYKDLIPRQFDTSLKLALRSLEDQPVDQVWIQLALRGCWWYGHRHHGGACFEALMKGIVMIL